MSEKTIKLKTVDIDLEKEQSVKIICNDFSMLVFRTYPQFKHPKPHSRAEAIYRLRQKRINKGICSRHGCPNKADKGFKTCGYHRELDRLQHKKNVRHEK